MTSSTDFIINANYKAPTNADKTVFVGAFVRFARKTVLLQAQKKLNLLNKLNEQLDRYVKAKEKMGTSNERT